MNVELEKEFVDWNPNMLIEVTLIHPQDFLKVKETLTRIGIVSKVNQTLYQSCHILHRKERYYICHFKELFALDGKSHNISIKDLQRRNTIIQLLKEWELLNIVDETQISDQCPIHQIKILRYNEIKSGEWKLEAKYNLGKYKRN